MVFQRGFKSIETQNKTQVIPRDLEHDCRIAGGGRVDRRR